MTPNGSQSLTDTELMAKVAQYDSKALEALYNRYAPLLYTLIKKIVGMDKLAEEVLSDLFVIIWRKADKFGKENRSPYTWLVTLARNKAVDALKRANNDVSVVTYTDEYEEEFIIPSLSHTITPLDLKNALAYKESAEKALSSLTDAQQYVLYLAYYEGLDENGIAKKLNIPLPTVKSKIKIAFSNLRDNLGEGIL